MPSLGTTQLFKTALEEEVQEKVLHPADIVTGNPLVIRMIISFYRVGGGGKQSLVDILGPLITQVLEDKTLHINISPVDIYKAWVMCTLYQGGGSQRREFQSNCKCSNLDVQDR